MILKPELYVNRGLAARKAQVAARFLHPVNDAPMVTWWQYAPLPNEDGTFFTASEKEFHGWFEKVN